MNKKGQALIEFILVLPVLLIIIMSIFDIGNIIYQKYILQDDLDIISDYILNGEKENASNYAHNKKILLKTDEEDDLINIKLEYKIKLNTPGLDKTLGNPYKITLEKRIIKNSPSVNINQNLEGKIDE